MSSTPVIFWENVPWLRELLWTNVNVECSCECPVVGGRGRLVVKERLGPPIVATVGSIDNGMSGDSAGFSSTSGSGVREEAFRGVFRRARRWCSIDLK